MLIEFRVCNYKSIREEQVFSLVASNSDRKNCPQNVIDRELPGMKGIRYLKGAAVYGANASGKTSLVQALKFMKAFVVESAAERKPDEPTGRKAFLLDSESRKHPSRFEVTFLHDGVRYQYGFALTDELVVEEFLTAYPKGVAQNWYSRTAEQDTVWPQSTYFKGHAGLQEKTRPNALYLSVGAQWNHPQLSPVYRWFKNQLQVLNLGGDNELHPGYTIRSYAEREQDRARIVSMLKSADFGISGLRIEDSTTSVQEYLEKHPEAADRFENDEDALVRQVVTEGFEHSHDGQTYVITPESESAGTLRFFAMAGPWIDILRSGRTVFIDELETSLHPVLVREMLKLLFSEETNPKGAQVVFTTHNATLLDQTLIRRDQVWFTEKDVAGVTHLYPLTDYSPRNGEALAKGYLAGRYGAIPFLEGGLRFDG